MPPNTTTPPGPTEPPQITIGGGTPPPNKLAQLLAWVRRLHYVVWIGAGAGLLIIGGTSYYFMANHAEPGNSGGITVGRDTSGAPGESHAQTGTGQNKTDTTTTGGTQSTGSTGGNKTTGGSSGGGGGTGGTSGGGSHTPQHLKVMPLGDSMTQGGVNGNIAGLDASTVNSYRLRLWNDLGSDYVVDYVGPYQTGDSSLADQDEAGESGACIKTTPCGGSTMYPLTAGWLNTYDPDLVIMQGGGNDYSDHSLTDADVEAYEEQWIQLVWQTKPNAKIIVSGQAQWHPELEALNKAYVEGLQAQGKAIRFVPLADTAAADANTIDHTHPNATGYNLWGDALAAKVRELYP